MGRPTSKGYFVKQRLTEARDARGYTQAKLANALGKAGSTISNWERGEQAPEPCVVEEIAAFLDVPVSYFMRAMPEYGDHAIFFRSFANAAIRARTRGRARLRWLQHTSLALQDTLDFPELNFPEFIDKGKYKKLSLADLEDIASDVRLAWGLGQGPIENMVLAAENAGVVIGVDETGQGRIDGQGNWCEADNRPYILLSKDKYTAYRRQMDVAHEIAHLVLHRYVNEEELEENFDFIEDQAKYLACAILLPDRAFASEIYSLSLEGFLALKKRWKTSVGAMIMRAHNLEIITDEAAQRLWKYRSARGWHKKEPYDLPTETPVHEPRLLRRSIEMIVDHKVRSKTDLLEQDIGLFGPEVELLSSLPAGYFHEVTNVVPLNFRKKDLDAPEQRADVIPFRRS